MTRILLVDDEPHLTFMVGRTLKARDIDVQSAKNGDEAMTLILEATRHGQSFDLVITDLQMPICDGLELARRMRANPDTEHTPIIMITGRGHRVAPASLAETTICDVIPKPFSLQDLIRSIWDALDLPEPEVTGRRLGEAA